MKKTNKKRRENSIYGHHILIYILTFINVHWLVASEWLPKTLFFLTSIIFLKNTRITFGFVQNVKSKPVMRLVLYKRVSSIVT